LIDNLKNRFEDKSLISAFDIFDPKKIPRSQMDQNDHNIMESTSTGTEEQQDCELFMTYGNDHIRNLSKQYQDDDVGEY